MKPKPERRISIRDFKTICRAIATYEDLNLLFEHLVEVISQAFDVKGCRDFALDRRLFAFSQLNCLSYRKQAMTLH